jgi:hypothetical protein
VRIGVDEKVLNDPCSAWRSLAGMRPSEKKNIEKRLVQIEQRKKQSYPVMVDMTGIRAAKAKREDEKRLAQ